MIVLSSKFAVLFLYTLPLSLSLTAIEAYYQGQASVPIEWALALAVALSVLILMALLLGGFLSNRTTGAELRVTRAELKQEALILKQQLLAINDLFQGEKDKGHKMALELVKSGEVIKSTLDKIAELELTISELRERLGDRPQD